MNFQNTIEQMVVVLMWVLFMCAMCMLIIGFFTLISKYFKQ